MSDNKDKLFIGVVVGLVGFAGITTIIYFFTKRKEKKTSRIEEPVIEIQKVETKIEPENKTKSDNKLNLTEKSIYEIPSQSTNISNSIRKNFEITTSISLELTKKKDFLSINKDTVEFLSVIPEKTSYKEKEYKEDEEDKDKTSPTNRHRQSEKATLKKFTKDKEEFLENNPPERIPTKLDNSQTSRSPSKNNNLNNQPINFYDISILNLNDFKDQIKKSQAFKDLNIDLSISLERPILPADIHKVAGDEKEFDSGGYIEEDEDDLKENIEGSLIKSFTVEEVVGLIRRKSSADEENFNNNSFRNKPSIKSNQTSNRNQNLEISKSSDKVIISTPELLHEVLFGKNKNEDTKYCLTYDEKEIKFSSEEAEISQILKPKIVLIILKYLFDELNSGLIELSDNFVEERRKYFTDPPQETYVSIINYFLRKKEEFFLCVLSDVMSKLDISQKNLDKTFFYYMNIADPNDDEIVINIREAYDKVYHAGVKYSIAPKCLTKQKLKQILKYQCETYEKLIREGSNYEPDVIEIIVTDYVYSYFGFDREAIRAAILKHNIQDDPEFSEILKWLESIKNSSFLNI